MDDVYIIQRFILGDWVDTADVFRILHISFSDGFRIFDFSRTASWCEPPLEGQHIVTKFRIKPKIE